MSEWLRLGRVPAPQPDPKCGFRVDLFVVSPYDIPEAIRGFKTSKGTVRIEFRYIDGPEAYGKERRLNDHVSVIEGRISGRPMAIEVDVESLGVTSLEVAVRTGVDEALTRLVEERDPSRRAPLEMAMRAIRTREHDLIGRLAAQP